MGVSAYFIMTDWAAGHKSFDIPNLMSSPTGLTGSEVSFFRIAQGMARHGHQVTVFAPIIQEVNLEGVRYRPFSSLNWDEAPRYAYAWNDPVPLSTAPNGVLRICNQQLNDFNYLPEDYDDWVDVWTSPSSSHLEVVGSQTPNADKWEIVNNGCDIHQVFPKIPGRVVWSSSFDRGLHWLLSIWPSVRSAVPHAELHVFYSMKKWLDTWGSLDHNSPEVMDSPQYRRAMFINHSLKQLQNHGVVLRDQVSRHQIEIEYSVAQILAYPCDTISYTEGFSVSILDACSFGCVPLISNTDALGSLYCKAVPHVSAPMTSNVETYKNKLIQLLQDPELLDSYVRSAWELSHSLTWDNSIRQFLNVLRVRGIQ